MMRAHSCPKCQGAMGEGFMLTEKGGTRTVSTWVPGPPQKRWWGLKLAAKPIEIATWRCPRCGYLENYAPVKD